MRLFGRSGLAAKGVARAPKLSLCGNTSPRFSLSSASQVSFVLCISIY